MKTLINGKWELDLPEHRAVRPEWPTWEHERLASMHANLKPGMFIYDIGAEEGDLPALWATWGCKVVLFEPNPRVWPNIRYIWEANDLAPPVSMYVGFAGDQDYIPARDRTLAGSGWTTEWPECAFGPLIGDHGFLNLCERPDVPSVRIDSMAEWIDPPDAITIDVEGAELRVLRGARLTLQYHRPLVWCSIHPTFMDEMYGDHPSDLISYLQRLDYRTKHLATDHEEHWVFIPSEKMGGFIW